MLRRKIISNPLNVTLGAVNALFNGVQFASNQATTRILAPDHLGGAPYLFSALSTTFKDADRYLQSEDLLGHLVCRNGDPNTLSIYPALFTHHPRTGIELLHDILPSLGVSSVGFVADAVRFEAPGIASFEYNEHNMDRGVDITYEGKIGSAQTLAMTSGTPLADRVRELVDIGTRHYEQQLQATLDQWVQPMAA